jgi:glycerate kinase
VSSYGVGEAIKICLEQFAVEEFVIGCGGSAFSDAGYGCMSAIFDLPKLKNFQEILSVQELKIAKTNIKKIVIPCDVQSPLCGPTGAAYMFGPQKGALPNQLPLLDQCVSHTVKLYSQFNEDKYQQVALSPGSGASGGIVGAFKAVFGDITQVRSGLDFIADLAHLEDKVKQADLVITGEGSYDDQSLQGKAVQRIIEMCQNHDTKHLVICGRNLNPPQDNIIDLTQRYGAEKSIKQTEACLQDLCETYLTSILAQN